MSLIFGINRWVGGFPTETDERRLLELGVGPHHFLAVLMFICAPSLFDEIGWGGHFVSKRRYHYIIAMDSEWHKPLSESDLDNQSHLLHGVIQCNGCGHFLCLNGIEGGTKVLPGREIMGLWDRIFTNLRAKKIAVEDASRKRPKDLRLLHGVAYGHSWVSY